MVVVIINITGKTQSYCSNLAYWHLLTWRKIPATLNIHKSNRLVSFRSIFCTNKRMNEAYLFALGRTIDFNESLTFVNISSKSTFLLLTGNQSLDIQHHKQPESYTESIHAVELVSYMYCCDCIASQNTYSKKISNDQELIQSDSYPALKTKRERSKYISWHLQFYVSL